MAEGDAQDLVARLRLIRSENIGPITYRHLLARFGSAAAALEAIPELAARSGGRVPAIVGAAAAERELEQARRLGARHLFLGMEPYPALLAQVEVAPPVLIVKGDVGLFERRAVALVGARNASAAGCRFARQLSAELGRAGLVVVSGLARGIDSAAHDGALESGTIAAIAGGIDKAFPPENEARQHAIGERGLLVAEQPPGTEPKSRHFPRRNRIIAGLALGTVVIEAAPKSGSLITARYAGEYGREVMAVPGSPLDPRAQGCNWLIREGATLVQNVEDVLEAISPIGGSVREPGAGYRGDSPADVADKDRNTVLDLLNATPVAMDELIRQSGLRTGMVHTILLELELGGRLERHAGGRVSLR